MRKLVVLGHCTLAALFLPGVCSSSFAASPASIQSVNARSDQALQPLRDLLRTSEARLDLAEAKLVIDHMIDPKIDVAETLQQLDKLAVSIKSRFPVGASSRTKLDILISSLYQPGPWNNDHPFSYDLNDPMGKKLRNKLLPVYIASRKGNCVSMPVLFVILGQKLGLRTTLATAPEHLLVKFGDEDTGQWLNVEATAGGFKYDSSYERETGMSQKAIENAIYLRPLTRRESAAVMMTTLMEVYAAQGQASRRIAVADMALEADPKDVVAMVHKASGIYTLMQDEFISRYPKPSDIPVEKRQKYLQLSQENLRGFANAEALGWVEPTQERQAKYLHFIEKEKSARRSK